MSSTAAGIREALSVESLLTRGDRVRILRLLPSADPGRYTLESRSGELSIDLDALAKDSPETLAEIAKIARDRLTELNTWRRA